MCGLRSDVAVDEGDAAVGSNHVPVAIDDQRRVGLVRGQESLEPLPCRSHLALVESALAEDGGEAGRQEDAVPLAERNVEALCEVENHLSARLRAPSR